jgi:outer membrane receptor protein involved in Fe transport
MQTEQGFRTRTPWQTSTDVHADYGFKLGGTRRIVALIDAFNLFNQQRVAAYDYYTEIGFQVPNPNFGRVIAYQNPRTIRLGARFEF